MGSGAREARSLGDWLNSSYLRSKIKLMTRRGHGPIQGLGAMRNKLSAVAKKFLTSCLKVRR